MSRLSWLLQSQPIGNYHHSHIARVYRLFYWQISRLEKQDGIFKSTTNFDTNVLDDEQSVRIDGRFVPITDREVDNLIETGEMPTQRERQDINFVKQFLTEHGERRSIEEIPAVEHNNYLSKFIFPARTKKGVAYEPSLLKGILSSVERHLRQAGYGKSIVKHDDFQKTRQMPLKQNRKNLSADKGRAINPKATTALSDQEIDVLYSKKVLGFSSPQALVNTVWLNNMLHRLQRLKTHSKQCFKEIISLEMFSISIWHRLKIKSHVQNWGRKRKKRDKLIIILIESYMYIYGYMCAILKLQVIIKLYQQYITYSKTSKSFCW